MLYTKEGQRQKCYFITLILTLVQKQGKNTAVCAIEPQTILRILLKALLCLFTLKTENFIRLKYDIVLGFIGSDERGNSICI